MVALYDRGSRNVNEYTSQNLNPSKKDLHLKRLSRDWNKSYIPGRVSTLRPSGNLKPSSPRWGTNPYLLTTLRVSRNIEGPKTLGNRSFSTSTPTGNTGAEPKMVSPTGNTDDLTEVENEGIPGKGKEIVMTTPVDKLSLLKATGDGCYTHLTKTFLGDAEFLKYAYHLIKNKEGNLTPSESQGETLDGISNKWFAEAAEQIRKGEYEFKRQRMALISKGKSGLGKRPLTISNPRDKVVQKAMHLVLNEIYEIKEQCFSDNSHGFRENRSCHTALQQIKKQ